MTNEPHNHEDPNVDEAGSDVPFDVRGPFWWWREAMIVLAVMVVGIWLFISFT